MVERTRTSAIGREHGSVSSACIIKQRCEGLLLMVAKDKYCNIESCVLRNITDAGIAVLEESCSRLESLTIYECNNITGEGIGDSAKGCSSYSC